MEREVERISNLVFEYEKRIKVLEFRISEGPDAGNGAGVKRLVKELKREVDGMKALLVYGGNYSESETESSQDLEMFSRLVMQVHRYPVINSPRLVRQMHRYPFPLTDSQSSDEN